MFSMISLARISGSGRLSKSVKLLSLILNEEKMKELEGICDRNKLHSVKVESLVSEMLYLGSVPRVRDKIIATFIDPPGLLQRDKAISDLTIELDDFIETFYEKGAA